MPFDFTAATGCQLASGHFTTMFRYTCVCISATQKYAAAWRQKDVHLQAFCCSCCRRGARCLNNDARCDSRAHDAKYHPRMPVASQCNSARKFLDRVQQVVAVLDDMFIPAAICHKTTQKLFLQHIVRVHRMTYFDWQRFYIRQRLVILYSLKIIFSNIMNNTLSNPNT